MRKSLIFKRYGRLTVKNELGSIGGRTHWSCVCDCGSPVVASSQNLTTGRITSCGCAKTKHGHSNGKHPLYQTWVSMRERCNNPKQKNYAHYGGRGIKVDPLWSDFERFIADMGERPKGYSLDRIDNDGDYGPGNCKWSSQQEQVLNSRRPRWITVNGVTKTVTDWAKDLGVSPCAITQRINTYGWSEEKACTTPKLR